MAGAFRPLRGPAKRFARSAVPAWAAIAALPLVVAGIAAGKAGLLPGTLHPVGPEALRPVPVRGPAATRFALSSVPENGSSDETGRLTATFRPDPNAVELPLDYENLPYDDRFVFARIRFEPPFYGRTRGQYWGLDLKWNHDYPWGERNFTRILAEYTSLNPNTDGGSIHSLNEAELFRRPFAYLCEVGFWHPSDQEAENLRAWLLKGGFLVVDDFVEPPALGNFLTQMDRVLPGYDAVRLEVTHPIFDSFFHIETLDFVHEVRPDLVPVYYGYFENNDPRRRLMVIANYNHDIGDYWEWSGSDFWPVALTNEAFKLGVNYVIYGMTH